MKLDPRESEGVIAIDDVDLHPDAQVQQRLVSALREALPEAQWIVTTASPPLASSVDARSVLALRRLRDGEGGEDARRIGIFAASTPAHTDSFSEIPMF